jgi:uroporphyrinogen-III synthase
MRPASIILTRSSEENRRIAPLFEAEGFRVHDLPMIELVPIPRDACGLRSVRRIAGGEPVLLTSSYATDLWLDLRETDFREMPPSAYYVVGERSAALLRDADPDIPIVAVADSGAKLLEICRFAGVTELLYPCSTERRDPLVEGLRARGVHVVDLPLYRPALPEGARARHALVMAQAEPPAAIVFFSPSAVANFFSLRPQNPSDLIFAAVGPTTAEALREAGIASIAVPDRPSASALAALLGNLPHPTR